MLREECRQPDGFLAQLATDRAVCVRGEVALVEQEVEHGVHARAPGLERGRWDLVEIRGDLAQMLARPSETLEHVGLADEQTQRDLRGAETAQGLQSQHESGISRNCL